MDTKTLNLLASISFPKISEIHVSRHLSEIPVRFKNLLSISELKRIENYNGSKFSSDFITDTSQLLPNIVEYGQLKRFVNVNYKQIELEFEISESVYPYGIGQDITSSKGKTNNLVLILHRNKNKWEVTTCFPGAYTFKRKRT